MNTIMLIALYAGLPLEVDPPGPYQAVTDGIAEQIPLLLAALAVVLLAALGIVFFKWGVPQIIGFFRRIAK